MIESKDDARKRGVKSPDRAEAIVLAFSDIRKPHWGLFEYYRQNAGIPDDPPYLRGLELGGRLPW